MSARVTRQGSLPRPPISRLVDDAYQRALDAVAEARRRAYLRGMVEGVAVGLALALLVWALSR